MPKKKQVYSKPARDGARGKIDANARVFEAEAFGDGAAAVAGERASVAAENGSAVAVSPKQATVIKKQSPWRNARGIVAAIGNALRSLIGS